MTKPISCTSFKWREILYFRLKVLSQRGHLCMTKPISCTSFKWREILFCLVSALQRWQRAIFGRPACSAGTELHIAFIAFDMVSSKKYEFIHQSEGQAQGTMRQPPNELFHHFKVGL